MTPRFLIAAAVVGATTLTAGAYYARSNRPEAEIATALVTRGSIIDAVAATGTLEAVTTVQVGAQLSGTVQELHADFNTIVRKGQVIARLDPSLYEAQVEQARANLIRAEADADRLSVAVADARAKLDRARQMSERSLIPAVELEAAVVAASSADAQLKSAQAQVTQARASLNQAEVNLQKTIITAPIDGIVIGRSVDVGQTVAASLQAPTLYVIAADLARMQVSASVDEAAIARVQPGQPVTFRVDAYPAEQFSGTVSQVRLNPVVVQNVVTYVAIIDVANHELRLKPGMTASVSIEIARRDAVLRAPAAALRFRPTEDVAAALGLPAGVEGGSPGKLPPAGGRAGSTRQVWIDVGTGVEPVTLTLGVSDGAFTEIIDGPVHEGTALVTNVVFTPASATTASIAGSPLILGPPGPGGNRGVTPGVGGAR